MIALDILWLIVEREPRRAGLVERAADGTPALTGAGRRALNQSERGCGAHSVG